MASPRTKRVLKDIRLKDDNNVSSWTIFIKSSIWIPSAKTGGYNNKTTIDKSMLFLAQLKNTCRFQYKVRDTNL